jgi:hypothetical protein
MDLPNGGRLTPPASPPLLRLLAALTGVALGTAARALDKAAGALLDHA